MLVRKTSWAKPNVGWKQKLDNNQTVWGCDIIVCQWAIFIVTISSRVLQIGSENFSHISLLLDHYKPEAVPGAEPGAVSTPLVCQVDH